jgi:IS1 family transposase
LGLGCPVAFGCSLPTRDINLLPLDGRAVYLPKIPELSFVTVSKDVIISDRSDEMENLRPTLDSGNMAYTLEKSNNIHADWIGIRFQDSRKVQHRNFVGAERASIWSSDNLCPSRHIESVCSSQISDDYLSSGIYDVHSLSPFRPIVEVQGIRREINGYPRPLFGDDKLHTDLRGPSSFAGSPSLPNYSESSEDNRPCSNAFGPSYEFVPPWQVVISACSFFCAGFLLFRRSREGGAVFLAMSLIFVGGVMLLVGHEEYGCDGKPYRGPDYHPTIQPKQFLHNREIVPQQPLDRIKLSGYSKYKGLVMANVLNTDKKIMVISALAEGSSIRSIERMSGVHRDTIMRLGVSVGQGCTSLMDATMRNLPCNRLEMDEIWGFIGKKDRHIREGDDPQFGNIWTFCVIDAETKLVPAFRVGNRDHATAMAFVRDVAGRMRSKVQISTDGLNAYVDAIEMAFGADADYGQIIKTYGVETSIQPQRRYSAPEITAIEKKAISGRPNFDLISTSYVERLNATTRLHMKRLARLTHAFSKKRVNFEAAVGLHFAYYNFVRRHSTIRCTPAMAAGVTPSFWSVGDLVEAAA